MGGKVGKGVCTSRQMVTKDPTCREKGSDETSCSQTLSSQEEGDDFVDKGKLHQRNSRGGTLTTPSGTCTEACA